GLPALQLHLRPRLSESFRGKHRLAHLLTGLRIRYSHAEAATLIEEIDGLVGQCDLEDRVCDLLPALELQDQRWPLRGIFANRWSVSEHGDHELLQREAAVVVDHVAGRLEDVDPAGESQLEVSSDPEV